MPLMAIHHENGIFALQEDGQTDLVLVGDGRQGSWTPEQIKEVERSTDSPMAGDEQKKKVIRIRLRPIPSPPHPLGIVIPGVPDDEFRSENPFISMRLDTAFVDGQLTDAVVEDIMKHTGSTGANCRLNIHAYLPPNFSVDLGALNRHASVLGEQVGRPVTFWVGNQKPGKWDK